MMTIAGQEGNSGFRNGDFKNTLFSNPFGIAYFQPNISLQLKENSSFIIILTNTSNTCLSVNLTNYTLCQYNNTNNTLINNTLLIKKMYTLTDDEILNLTSTIYSNFTSLEVLFIADKNNHCIRLLDIQSRTSTTYAGICGQPGFQDGMLGSNLLNFPESLGVDLWGNVFVFDSGNNYIRLIKPDKCMVTLVPGACRRDFRFASLQVPGKSNRNDVVTCYRQWMNSTAGDSMCYSENNENFCYQEIFLCPNFTSPFIYNKQG